MRTRLYIAGLVVLMSFLCTQAKPSIISNKSQKNRTDYHLKLDFKASGPVNLNSRSQIKITVWGYDQRIADQAPTALTVETFDLPSLAVEPTVSFSEEALLAVQPNSGRNSLLVYFMMFDLDANGDGQICVGDYRQDYNRSDTRVYTQNDDRRQVEKVFLTKIVDKDECRPF